MFTARIAALLDEDWTTRNTESAAVARGAIDIKTKQDTLPNGCRYAAPDSTLQTRYTSRGHISSRTSLQHRAICI